MEERVGTKRIGTVVGRIVGVVGGLFASAVLVLLWVGPALAVAGRGPIEATQQEIGPSTPEPGAAILFALGAGAVAWSTRRRRAR